MGKPFSDERFCYHIYPHIVLPLAFALGASVNLRKPLVLYHCQNHEKFYRVIDLKDPREVSYKPETNTITLKTVPEDLNLTPPPWTENSWAESIKVNQGRSFHFYNYKFWPGNKENKRQNCQVWCRMLDCLCLSDHTSEFNMVISKIPVLLR